jgi:hypothetical protein
MEMCSRLHSPAAVSRGSGPFTHRIGDWVDPRARLDPVEKRKSSVPGIEARSSSPEPVAVPNDDVETGNGGSCNRWRGTECLVTLPLNPFRRGVQWLLRSTHRLQASRRTGTCYEGKHHSAGSCWRRHFGVVWDLQIRSFIKLKNSD